MKGLRSFRGAGEGKVRRGREFTVVDIRRANELEASGLAVRIEARPVTTEAPAEPPANPAAEQGPFDLAGGKIGEGEPAPSSPPAPAPRRRRSRNSGSDLPL
jgi:hypothetical protein